jgi:hypothetical protein
LEHPKHEMGHSNGQILVTELTCNTQQKQADFVLGKGYWCGEMKHFCNLPAWVTSFQDQTMEEPRRSSRLATGAPEIPSGKGQEKTKVAKPVKKPTAAAEHGYCLVVVIAHPDHSSPYSKTLVEHYATKAEAEESLKKHQQEFLQDLEESDIQAGQDIFKNSKKMQIIAEQI